LRCCHRLLRNSFRVASQPNPLDLVLSEPSLPRALDALIAEVKYLTWTDDNLLRQVIYEGLREDKPAAEVRRPVPLPNR
jgi:hypothetical protein